MSPISSFRNIENNYDVYKDKDCIKKFCHQGGEYRGAAPSICNLKYGVPNKISIVFHSESNYDYHFAIKELAEKLKK